MSINVIVGLGNLTRGLNILARDEVCRALSDFACYGDEDSASLVPDKKIHPSGVISFSHMETPDEFYKSQTVV